MLSEAFRTSIRLQRLSEVFDMLYSTITVTPSETQQTAVVDDIPMGDSDGPIGFYEKLMGDSVAHRFIIGLFACPKKQLLVFENVLATFKTTQPFENL